MGSKRMIPAPTTTAAAVNSMGRKRTAPASMTAASSAIPSCKRSSTKSTRMMEFRTTIPAPAIKPIIEVAVKNAFIMPCAGRMPTSENGIAAMMMSGLSIADKVVLLRKLFVEHLPQVPSGHQRNYLFRFNEHLDRCEQVEALRRTVLLKFLLNPSNTWLSELVL